MYIQGKITKLRIKSVMPAEIDAKILNKMRPYTEIVQILSRRGLDVEIDTLVTRALSKYKPFLDITEDEVDLYTEALIFEES